MYSSFNSSTNSKSYPQVSSSSDNDDAGDDVGEAKDVDEDDVVEDVNVDGDDGSGNDEDDKLDITIRT